MKSIPVNRRQLPKRYVFAALLGAGAPIVPAYFADHGSVNAGTNCTQYAPGDFSKSSSIACDSLGAVAGGQHHTNAQRHRLNNSAAAGPGEFLAVWYESGGGVSSGFASTTGTSVRQSNASYSSKYSYCDLYAFRSLAMCSTEWN